MQNELHHFLCTVSRTFTAGAACAAFALTSNAAADDAARAAWMDLAQLQTAVRDHVRARAQDEYAGASGGNLSGSGSGAIVDVTVSPIDPRVRLAACDDLAITLRGTRVLGRVAAAARCTTPLPWQVYVSATVDVTVDVVVASSPIARNSVTSAADLTLEPRSIAPLRGAWMTDLDQALGRESKRQIRQGDVVYASSLRAPRWVRKGDRVSIVAGSRGVAVETVGLALADGTEGSQITVRNSQSERVVHGWVIAPGRVSTRPDTPR